MIFNNLIIFLRYSIIWGIKICIPTYACFNVASVTFPSVVLEGYVSN